MNFSLSTYDQRRKTWRSDSITAAEAADAIKAGDRVSIWAANQAEHAQTAALLAAKSIRFTQTTTASGRLLTTANSTPQPTITDLATALG